jgi:hypothetical protein
MGEGDGSKCMPKRPTNDGHRTGADHVRLEAVRPPDTLKAAAHQLRFLEAISAGRRRKALVGPTEGPLGTTSSDFVNATLVQIQNASRMPWEESRRRV